MLAMERRWGVTGSDASSPFTALMWSCILATAKLSKFALMTDDNDILSFQLICLAQIPSKTWVVPYVSLLIYSNLSRT